MIGSLRNHWEYTPVEIWEPLAARENSPPDLFNDLYGTANELLALPTSDALVDTHGQARGTLK